MLRRVLGLMLLFASAPAAAYPLLVLRPGGSAFEGPTDPELSAIWWNPAALAEMRRFHVSLDGTLVLDRGSIDRDAICTNTGLPGACDAAHTRAFPSVPIADTYGTGFGGVGWDFRQDNVTIAFGVYTPWQSQRSFPEGALDAGSASTPTAYHLRSESFTTIYYSLALGIQLTSKIAIGGALGLSDSWASLRFDRDSALDGGSKSVATTGYESAAAAQHLSLRGDGGHFWNVLPSPSGLTLGIGLMVRPTERLWLGASWQRMFPLFRSGDGYGSSDATGATIAGPAPCDANPCRGGVSIDYDIPDVWQAGARIQLRDDLELSTWARVVVYGGYHGDSPGLTVRLSGGATGQGTVPEQIVLARDLTPSFAGEVGLRWRALPWLRVGASAIGATSAVPGASLTPESIDGPKFDAMISAEVKLRWFRVRLGYELTALFLLDFNTPHPGRFDPGDTVRCVDSNNSLDACSDALAGRGLPTAAGHYTMLNHRLDLGLSVDF